MPAYEDSDNLIRNAKSNLRHVVDHPSKPSETFISNEASGDHHPDHKAYVRTMASEFEANKGSTTSTIGVSTQDANIVKEHEAPHMENIHLDADVTQILLHDRGSQPKMQLASKAANNARLKCTVPQPFALTTNKRASSASKFAAATISNNNKKRTNMNSAESPIVVKKKQASLHLEPRKTLQSEHTKHIVEEDVCSVISLSTPSVKAYKSRHTVASAPTFRVSERAEKWKEFYTKLERKQQAVEAERIAYEARKKEEEEAALKELRKNMNFKASPMPSFYHDGPPPKTELKKIPATRAKSPKFSQRRSCGAHNPSPASCNSKIHCRPNRQSFVGTKDAKQSRRNIKNGNALCRVEEADNQNEAEQTTAEATIQS